MKVLVCAYSCLKDPDQRFGDGGEGVLGWELVKQIARFNQVWVLTHFLNRKTIEMALEKNPFLNVNFYYLKLPFGLEFLNKIHGGIQFYAYLWQIWAYFIARKLHKKQNFNIFHHITYANDWMASFMGAFLPIPYIRGPGGGAHRVPKEFLKKYYFKEKLLDATRSVGQWIFKHDPFFVVGQDKAKAILVCNNESFNALPKKWQKKAHFFPVNGISGLDFDFLNSIKKPEKQIFTVFSAGKLLKIKSFDIAIRAFAVFNKKKFSSQFIIIGSGPELYNLQNLAQNLGIGKSVVFKNWMPRQKILEAMAESDLFLFSSLRDGGGNVVVEAMAAGLPVVCFDLAGPGFHIDETCGIKVEPKNNLQAVKEMADALNKLYSNSALREKLSQGAIKKAKQNYDWDKLGKKLQEIYENIHTK